MNASSRGNIAHGYLCFFSIHVRILIKSNCSNWNCTQFVEEICLGQKIIFNALPPCVMVFKKCFDQMSCHFRPFLEEFVLCQFSPQSKCLWWHLLISRMSWIFDIPRGAAHHPRSNSDYRLWARERIFGINPDSFHQESPDFHSSYIKTKMFVNDGC